MKKIFLLLILLVYEIPLSAQYNTLKDYFVVINEAMNENRTDDAIMYLKNASERFPFNYVPSLYLGLIYVSLEDYATAEKYYLKVLESINPKNISYEFKECGFDDVSYRKIMTMIYEGLSTYNISIGYAEQAIYYLNHNIKLNITSGYKAPVMGSMDSIYKLYFKDAAYNECLKYFSELQMLLPTGNGWEMCESLCHAIKGDCYAYLGLEDKMLLEYKMAAKLGHNGAIQVLEKMGVSY